MRVADSAIRFGLGSPGRTISPGPEAALRSTHGLTWGRKPPICALATTHPPIALSISCFADMIEIASRTKGGLTRSEYCQPHLPQEAN